MDSKTKVSIICERHSEFLQTPNHHLNGCGCPKCAGRKYTANDFIEEANKIHNFKYDYSWLTLISKQRIDFYLPKYKIGIECQGIQHYKSIEYLGGEK